MKRIVFLLLIPTLMFAQRPTFTLNQDHIKTFNYAEITVHLPPSGSVNPCLDVPLTGTFTSQMNESTSAEGFCDSSDGSTYRIRFMPTKPGTYRFTIKSYAIRRRQMKNVLTTGLAQTGSYTGTITATNGKRVQPVTPVSSTHTQAVLP